jgi:hypothetical protein
MESRISLALAAKLKMIFEREDRFLTYPLGPGFSYKDLNFMKDPSVSDLTLQEQLNNKGNFARLLNIIPDDSARFSPDASRLLWNELKNVLNGSIFAVSALTQAENTLLDQAIDFLTDMQKQENGPEIPVNSTAVNKYYEYRKRYQDAESTYLDEKITVENSTGPEGEKLRQEWGAYREKQLLDLKNQAEVEWKNLGFKEQVEYFQSVRNSLETKKYLDLYRKAYLNEINVSEIPDLNGLGIGFYTTFFSPSDAFDTTLPWTTITLTKEEMNTLVQNAPAELKDIFAAGEEAGDIESVSLEYNNVVVIRPWHKPEFYESRYWKLPDGTIVSDGNVPRKGRIPAYITSMIVVRNVRVTRKKTTGPKLLVLPIFSKIPIQTLKISDTMKPVSPVAPHIIEAGVKPKAIPAAVFARPVAPLVVRDHRTAPVKSSFFLSHMQPLSPHPATVPHEAALNIQSHERIGYVNAKYIGTTVKTSILTIPPKPPPPPVQDVITETYNLDGVVVLVYVCKRVPKSPDPDMTLQWW